MASAQPAAATPTPCPDSAIFASGTGAQENPFLVSTAVELANISSNNDCLSGGYYFLQTQNIDLAWAPWTPIGSVDSPFNGTYLGGNHQVTNMLITGDSDVFSSAGLFGSARNSFFSDLSISGTVGAITKDVHTAHLDRIGGLVGELLGNNSASRISNVHADVDITNGGMYVGGLVGSMQVDNGVTWVVDSSASGDVNAIASYFNVADETADPPIAPEQDANAVGGLIGAVEGGSLLDSSSGQVELTNVSATGNVTATGRSPYDIGGLVGYTSVVTLVHATSSGDVVVNSDPIDEASVRTLNLTCHGDATPTDVPNLSTYEPNTTVTINVESDCEWKSGFSLTGSASWVTAPVTGQDDSAVVLIKEGGDTFNVSVQQTLQSAPKVVTQWVGRGEIEGGHGATFIGGLIGNAKQASLSNTKATGDVTVNGPARLVGGLTGIFGSELNIDEIVDQCGVAIGITGSRATGNVTASLNDSWYVGGLVGGANSNCILSGNGSAIDSSYATGDVQGQTSVGGLIGIIARLNLLTKSYATGDVTSGYLANNALYWGSGGLVGMSLIGNTITDSSASGDVVTQGGVVGGLVGHLALGNVIADSWASGNVSSNPDSGSYCNSLGFGWYSNSAIGGLVGLALLDTQIIRSHATGAVSSVTASANTFSFGTGGLVGMGAIGVNISKSYAVGDVITDGIVAGGLAGIAGSSNELLGLGGGKFTVVDAYSRGDVTSTYSPADLNQIQDSWVGGLIGDAGSIMTSTIRNTYVTGEVTVPIGMLKADPFANSELGIGWVDVDHLMGQDSNFVLDTSGTSTVVASATQAQLQNAATFPASWDFENTWVIDSATNNGFPHFQAVKAYDPIPNCEPVAMPVLTFKKGSAALSKANKKALRESAQMIKASHCPIVNINGYHAKNIVSKRLASKRTAAVKTYLRGKLWSMGYPVTFYSHRSPAGKDFSRKVSMGMTE
ncbi:MAG: hypothetical protein F2839_06015 [Actinobacteria bacterium]|nr:hypothetical protein [Actinomycetota bacterium]